MSTFQQMQEDAVLSAKLRIACVAEKNYEAENHGDSLDDCCIQKVLFTYGLMEDVQCYEIDGTHNCWTEDEFLQGVQLLNGLLT